VERTIERRDPGIILVLSVFTCGFYLIYWYFVMYDELEYLTGETPTGNNFWVDFLLNIVTCSLYGVWVDYKMSQQLTEYERAQGLPMPGDSTNAVVMLDVAAYVTGFFTNYLSSAIQQDQLNKAMRKLQERGDAPGPASGGPPATF